MKDTIFLEGIWERQGDEFAGCSVRVVANSGGLWEGRLVYVTRKAAAAGWIVGDRKWVDLTPSGPCKFAGRDLQKAYDYATGEVVRTDYVEKVFLLRERRLVVRGPRWWDHFGATQEWHKLG